MRFVKDRDGKVECDLDGWLGCESEMLRCNQDVQQNATAGVWKHPHTGHSFRLNRLLDTMHGSKAARKVAVTTESNSIPKPRDA